MSTAIFMSKNRGQRVSFDPELFGTTENYKGQQVLWPTLSFDENRIVLDENKTAGTGLKNQKKYAEMLREHSCNIANGGNDFWEVPQEDSKALLTMEMFAEGKPVSQSTDVKLKSDDIRHLKDLDRWANKAFAPTQREQVVNTVVALKERFQVLGIQTPEPEMKTSKIKAICLLLLDYFEESGIWNGETVDEGQEDS